MTVATIDSQGTLVAVDGVVVGGVKGVSGLGSGSPSERDRTTLADTKFKRIGMGLRDGGQVTLDILVDTTDAGQRKLYRYWKDATRGSFTLTLVNGSTRTFYAYVTTFAENLNSDTDVMGSCQLRVDGEITGFPDPS
jgi:hypothetical protein